MHSPCSTYLFTYTTLVRSRQPEAGHDQAGGGGPQSAAEFPAHQENGGEQPGPAGEHAACGRHRLRVEEGDAHADRSEEHTSELQSRFELVCRLLLEKKKID